MPDFRKPIQVRVDFELCLTLSAFFISVCALVVSVVQTRIAREQQTASVWPRLLAGSSVLDRNFYFTLTNQGVGPAIVKRVEVEYEGKHYPLLSEFLYHQAGSPKNGGFFLGDPETEDVFKSGDEATLFRLVLNDEPLSNRLLAVVQHPSFHLRIEYADVYGNCWLLDRTGGRNRVTEKGHCGN